MTDSNSTGAAAAHQDIETFASRFSSGVFPRLGETFERSGHLYRVAAYGDFEGVPLVIFTSQCNLCGAPFRAAVNWAPMGQPVMRCAEHRVSPGREIVRVADLAAQSKGPRKKRKKRAKKEGPRAPTFGRFEDVVLGVVDELSLVYTDIELDMLLKRAKDMIEAPPEGERDTRRQQCLRAVYSVAKKKGWDVAGGVLYTDK